MAAARSRPGETTEPWTVGRVLAWATADFRSRAIETARLDAELLLGLALGLDRIRLILEHQRPLAPEELSRYRDLIKRRRGGEPIAYIRGEREFYGLPIRVDPRVLIPRPDTETLVEVALERTRARSMFGNALDLCTGSGCVAIAFSHTRRTWRVTGVDASIGALEVARINALCLGVVPGLRFLEGDLFAPLGPDERFDLITANPPYIPDAELAELDAGIREFEPRLALAGGSDGLDVIRRIVEEAPGHLSPGGVLALEVGHDQADRVAELFEQAGLSQIGRRRDYGGHERVVSAAAS
jgi:release factor glutamine methyltransferase